MKIASALACAALFLAGCGAVPERPVADQRAALDAKTLCCADFKSIRYEPLALKTIATAVLDESAPVRQFPHGRGYFRGYALPAGPEMGVWIKSYFNGPLIKQYLEPAVLFLDADHRPLGAAAPGTRFRRGNMFEDNNAHMGGGVRIPAQARYLLLFAAPSDNAAPASADIPGSTGAMLIGNTPIVTTQPGKTITLERAVTGELALLLEDLSQPK